MVGPSTLVVDTNFVTRGRYQSDRIRRLVGKLSSRGHTVVIPEIVIWEWVSHLHHTISISSRNLGRTRGEIHSAGLQLNVPSLDIPQPLHLLGLVEADLASIDGVKLTRCQNGDAAAAIQQQVLQTGVGMTKRGVKTGAADALVLAALRRELQSSDDVLLCTNDLVLATEAESTHEVEVLRTMRDLWKWYGTTTPASSELLTAVQTWVCQAIDDWHAGNPLAIPFHRLELSPASIEQLRSTSDLPHDRDPYSLEATLRLVDSFSVTDLSVTSDERTPNVGVASVHLVGAVTLDEWVDTDEGELMCLSDDVRVVVELQLLVEFDAGWALTHVDPLDPPAIRPVDIYHPDAFSDPPSTQRAS